MFDAILSLISATGALGVGIVMFAENLFPPIPSELIMPLAGYLSATGELRLLAVLVAGTVGAVAGAYPWYVAGAKLGKARLFTLVDSYGRWLTVNRSDLEKALAWFDKHQGAVIFWGRMVPGVRTFISVPAGIAGMPIGRFTCLTALGSFVWNCALLGSGYVLRANYDVVGEWLNPVTTGIVVLIVATYAYRLITHRP